MDAVRGVCGRQKLSSRIARTSTKWILPLVLVAPVLVVASALTLLAHTTGKRSAGDLANQSMQQIHKRIEEHLTRLLDMPPAINELNKRMLATGELSLSKVDRNRVPVFETLNIFQAVSSVVIGRAEGETMWVIRYPGESTYEYAIKRSPEAKMEEYALDEKGRTVGKRLSQYDFHPTLRPWYKAAIAADGPTWGEVYVWVRGGKGETLGIPYVEPYRDANSNILGVIDTEFTLSDISVFLGQLEVGKTGKAFIMEGDGNLIATSEALECMTADLGRLPAMESPDSWIAAASRELLTRFGSPRTIAAQQQAEIEVAGQSMRMVLSPYHNRRNLDWFIVTLVPNADFLADIEDSRLHSMVLGGIAVALMSIVSIVMAMKIIRAQDRIKQQRDMLETTIESFAHPFYVIDANDYTIKIMNTTARKLRSEGSLSLTCHALTHRRDKPCNSEEHPCPLEIVKKTKKPVILEHIHYDADGNQIYAEVHGYPIFNSSGEVIQMIEYSQDITERKQADQELRKLSGAVEQSPSIVVITDVKGSIEYVNPKFTEITGYTYDEAIGQNPRILKSDRLPPEFYKDMWDTIASGNEWRGEFCNRKKNGDLHWESASISPIRNASDEITHYVAVKEDVTERKKMEEEIGRINFLSDIALELTKCGYWHIDYSEPDYYYQSERAAEILGEHPKPDGRYHLQDEWYARLIEANPEAAQKTSERYQGAIDGRYDHYESTYAYKRPIDGEIVWVHAVGKVVRDPDGKIQYMYGVYQDVSDHIAAQEQLRQAREASEEANQAKSKFLANMSHELRTPMNAIIGYSEMLMEEAEDLEQEEFVPDLKKIHGAGKHLLALINDILDLSKIEAGKMELFLESFNVEHMLDEINSTVDTLVKKKSNKFVLDFVSPLGDMNTDLTKVRQALFNLISNAAKFTENGTVTLAAIRKTTDNREWIEFHVSDTGIGIPEDKLEILFDEFTQADDSTTRNYGGTGLGLAITKRFCEMMGGTISIKSQLGEGSTFTICLPAELSAAAEKEESAEAATEAVKSSLTELVSQSSSPESSPNKILVIDDDPDMRDLMTKSLLKEGYEVVTASSGEEGLSLAKEWHPAVITLDVLMPQVDGWKVLKSLKSDPQTREIPVIMLTMMSDKSMGLSLGATEYLTKPVDRDHLLQILNRCCPAKSTKPILILEDDTTMREMLCRTLTKEGWEVREAENGKVALELIRHEVPGMILLDLMMPIMDGFTFLKELRKEDRWRDIPVIVITSKDITRQEKQLLEEKVVTILQKGEYTRQNLLEQVSSSIKQFIPKETP